jgi:hypothetical protein
MHYAFLTDSVDDGILKFDFCRVLRNKFAVFAVHGDSQVSQQVVEHFQH